jgi:hypothetical protein
MNAWKAIKPSLQASQTTNSTRAAQAAHSRNIKMNTTQKAHETEEEKMMRVTAIADGLRDYLTGYIKQGSKENSENIAR